MTDTRRVLTIDVGGNNIKVLRQGDAERRKTPSGPGLTPKDLVKAVQRITEDLEYDVIAMGFPGPVRDGEILAEPRNLGNGWVGFDFAEAFGRPVRIMNDAAMQALGSYRGGTMLFLGLGTGLGTALVLDGKVKAMEAGHLPYRKGHSFEHYVGRAGRDHLGEKKWRKHVARVVAILQEAFVPDETVLGGGDVRKLEALPPGCRQGDNANAFLGGFRLWERD